MGAELNPATSTDTAASAALGGQWHGAGLTELIDRLREAGFRAGAAETVTAGRLLARLAGLPRAPQKREDLLAWLRPVFCSTREEQARFDAIFLDWAKRFGLSWQPRAAPAASGADAGGTGARAAGAKRRWGSREITAVLALLLLAGGLLTWWLAPPRGVPDVAVPTPAPAQASAPWTAASAVAGRGAASLARPDLPGLFPAQRESRSLRPTVVWSALAVPVLLALLLLGGLPGLQLMQGRRRSGRRVVLDTEALADEARQSLPALLPAVAGRLERHVRGDSDTGTPLARRRRLDARRTVEATLRNHGILSPRYRLAPLRPSYLMLIDAANEHDPRGRLFYLWAERLKREGLSVDIRLFRPAADEDAAPVCWQGVPSSASSTGQSLDDLDDPPPGQRLVVISEAPAWLGANGQWKPWFARARLARWPQRAFFTPTELRDWGAAEEALERPEHSADPGFLTLPLDESALDAWSVLLANGSLPAFSLAEPQRFPRLLSTSSYDPFSPPTPADLDRLIAQLKLYLGDSGFRWLAALAVPPLVRWELTLLLGRALFDHRAALIGERWRDVLARSYRRLARLPWLRGGTDRAGTHHGPALPDWLRLRLLDELPPDAQAEIRLVVDRLLSSMRPEAGGDLALDLEAPPGNDGPAGGASGDGDALYLGFLTGLTPRQLALRQPGGWEEWLRRERLAEPGWSARALRGARGVNEWLRARLARLAFRDGMPYAPRRLAPLAAAAVAFMTIVSSVLVLARTPAGTVAPWLERVAFDHATRFVALPRAAHGRAIALSPGGAYVLGWGENAALRLWSATTGRTLHDFAGGANALTARFDAAGLRVLACDERGVVRAWPVEGGAATVIEDAVGAPGLRYTDCQIGADGRVRLLQPPGEETRLIVTPQTPLGHTLADTAAALLSPNGRWVLRVASGGERARMDFSLWSVEAQAFRPGAFSSEDAWVDWAGDTLATLQRDAGRSTLVWRDLQRGTVSSLALDDAPTPAAAGRPPSPRALAVSGDGRYAAVGDDAGGVALWNLDTRQRVAPPAALAGGVELETLRLSDDGGVLLSATAGGQMHLARAWQPPLAISLSNAVQAALSADGRRAAFAYGDGRIVLRDADDPAQDTILAGLAPPTLLAFSTDGRRLAQADAKGVIRFWPALPGSPSVDLFASRPLTLGFSPAGDRLEVFGGDGRWTGWPIVNDRVTAATTRQTGSSSAAIRRADGLIAAVDDIAGVLQLIGPDGSVRALGSVGAVGAVPTLAFSNLGQSVWASRVGGNGVVVDAWDVRNGTRYPDTVANVAMAERRPVTLAADDVHARLATVNAAGELSLWNATTGEYLDTPPSGRTGVRLVRWLGDGRLLVADRSGGAGLWAGQGQAAAMTRTATAGIDLGGDPVSLDLSADGHRLVASVVSHAAVAAAAASVPATPARPRLNTASPAQTKAAGAANARAQVQRQEADVKALMQASLGVNVPIAGAANAAEQAPVPTETVPAAPDAAAFWALPVDTPQPGPATWLSPHLGPNPVLLGLAGLACAAGLAAWNLRRTRQRLARRQGPAAAAGPGPLGPMATEA